MTVIEDAKLRAKFWKDTKPEQCERCLDWQQRGLSSTCPTCDMGRQTAYERLCEQAEISP